jgi:hypothetical protein
MADDPSRDAEPPDLSRPVPGAPELPGGLPSISVGMAFAPRASAGEAIVAKLTARQIDKIVDRDVEESKDRHRERMETIQTLRRLGYAALLSLVVIVIAFLYYGKPELLKDIIVFLCGAGVGTAGGYGIGRAKPSREPGDGSTAV